jgi:hypothetical protein
MATTKDTSCPHSQKAGRKRENGFRHHEQLANMIPPWNDQWQNILALRTLNKVLWCTNLTLTQTGSHMSKQSQVVSKQPINSTMLHAKAYKRITFMKLIALSREQTVFKIWVVLAVLTMSVIRMSFWAFSKTMFK